MDKIAVTPFVGVWIEILNFTKTVPAETVTPFVGVWIEIVGSDHASAERLVTPFVGVWIEISKFGTMELHLWSHSLRGSVD